MLIVKLLIFINLFFLLSKSDLIAKTHDSIAMDKFKDTVSRCWSEDNYECVNNLLTGAYYDMDKYSELWIANYDLILGQINISDRLIQNPDKKLGLIMWNKFYKENEFNDQYQEWLSYVSTNKAWIYYTDIELRDFKKAKKWAYNSLKFVTTEATHLNNMGVYYEEGYLFEKDLNKAFKYYKDAANFGDNRPWGFENVGRFHTFGRGPAEQSYRKAIYYFDMALKVDDDINTNSTARIYKKLLEKKQDTPLDEYEMAKWIEEEIITNNEKFFIQIGWLLVDYNIDEALMWFVLASDHSDNDADMLRADEIISYHSSVLDEEIILKARENAESWKLKYLE